MSIPFSDESFSTQNLGEILRHRREAKQMSIATLSQLTRINSTILQDIEEGHFDKLPSPAYAKGFVKSIGKSLKIPMPELEEYLNNIYGLDPILNKRNERKIPLKKTPSSINIMAKISSGKDFSKTNQAKVFFWALPFFLIIGIIFFVKTRMDQNIENLNHQTSPVTSTSSSNAIPTQEVEQVLNVKALPALPALAPKEIENNKIALPPQHPFRSITTPLFSIAEKENEEILDLPASARKNFDPNLQNIFLNASETDSWIAYKKDDEAVKRFILKKGATLSLKGQKILLFAGNTHSLKIFYNNKLVKLDTRYSVNSLIFPPEVASEYFLPLFITDDQGTLYSSVDYLQKIQKGEAPSKSYTELMKKKYPNWTNPSDDKNKSP
ncbi:MAG: helix-turn-helix domain-containing protein [Bacteriovoracaceae bacterium]|nr:helix-turn-helix domain-containing protein [Bacteriovoracaceae bacterium]